MRPFALLALTGLLAAVEVPDGGFEQGGAGWALTGAAGRGELTVVGEAAAGSKALRLALRPGASGPLAVRSPVLAGLEAGASVRLTLLARGERPGQRIEAFLYSDPHQGRHWHRRTEATLGDGWTRLQLDTRLPAAGELRPVCVQLQIPDGAVVVDQVALAALPAEAGPARPARRNLLDDPGFDLGSESWTLESWLTAPGIDRRAPAWRSDGAHSPPRCLLLPGLGDSLVSRRYPVVPGRAYVLSAWLRLAAPAPAGDAARLFLLTPDWRIERSTIPAGDLAVSEWRRVSVRFAATDRGSAYRNTVYVRLDPLADLLVDSLQLEEAAVPGAWEPGPQVAVASALPLRLAPLGAATVTVTASGVPRPARVRLALRDAAGGERWRGEAAAGSGVAVAVPLARRGVHELAAELVADDDGELLAEAGYRLLAADPAEPVAPHPLIGIDTSPLSGTFAGAAWAETQAAGLGAGFARSFFKAHNGARAGLAEDGDDFLAYAAAALDPAFQRGKTVMMVVGPAGDSPLGIHHWRKQNAIPGRAALEAEIPRLAARCARIAAAMRGRVASLEVLNEPNIWIVGGRLGMPAELYARVLAACAPGIRAAGLRVAANVNGIDRAYVQALLAAGAGAHLDELTVHPYRATAENPPIYEDLRRLRAAVDVHRPGLPIINSEQYYLVLDRYSEHEHDRNYAAAREDDMAGRVMQALLHQWAALGTPYTLFSPASTLFRPLPGGDVRYAATFGMVRAAGRLLAGCGAGEDVPTHPAVRAFLFARGDGRRVAVLSTRRYELAGTIVPPEGAAAFDMDGNPLAGGPCAVGWLPLYLEFPAAADPARIRAALAAAVFTGLDFPLAPRFAVDADGSAVVTVANAGNRPAGGAIELLDAPAGWPLVQVAVPELAAGARHRAVLPAAAPLPRFAGGELRWRGTSAGQVQVRRERLPALAAPRRARPPAVDGGLDDWAGAAWTALAPSADFDPSQPHRGDADCSARAALAWDDDALYLAVAVRDDRAGPPPDDLRLYAGDSLQVYLDPRNDARPDQAAYDPDDAVWSLGPGAAGVALAVLEKNPGDRYVGAANAETGPDPAVRVACRRDAAGWTLEAAFPLHALAGLRLQPGERFGLALLVNDNDGAGRKQGATLGPAGTQPYQRPWLWPLVELTSPPSDGMPH